MCCIGKIYHSALPFIYWKPLNRYFGKHEDADEMHVGLHCKL